MLCSMTGEPHRLFWMRSAWWCQDCRQKVEGCCEGGGCPTVAEVLPVAHEPGRGLEALRAQPDPGNATTPA
jgi:hypothetical protein